MRLGHSLIRAITAATIGGPVHVDSCLSLTTTPAGSWCQLSRCRLSTCRSCLELWRYASGCTYTSEVTKALRNSAEAEVMDQAQSESKLGIDLYDVVDCITNVTTRLKKAESRKQKSSMKLNNQLILKPHWRVLLIGLHNIEEVQKRMLHIYLWQIQSGS